MELAGGQHDWEAGGDGWDAGGARLAGGDGWDAGLGLAGGDGCAVGGARLAGDGWDVGGARLSAGHGWDAGGVEPAGGDGCPVPPAGRLPIAGGRLPPAPDPRHSLLLRQHEHLHDQLPQDTCTGSGEGSRTVKSFQARGCNAQLSAEPCW